MVLRILSFRGAWRQGVPCIFDARTLHCAADNTNDNATEGFRFVLWYIYNADEREEEEEDGEEDVEQQQQQQRQQLQAAHGDDECGPPG